MSQGEVIIYRTDDGQAEIQLRVEGETAWLTQFEMAELFHTSVPNINIHIRNILDSGELDPESTIKEDLIVRQEGARQVRRKVKLYNLSMILAVGYRVQSPRGTQFRQWATAHLEEYLVKGFIMDDRRLKEPGGRDRSRKPHPLEVVFLEQSELRAKGRQDLTLDYCRNNVDRLLEFNDRC